MELQRKIKPNIDRNFLANEADPGLCNTNTMILVSDIDVAESWRISNRRCSTCHGSHRVAQVAAAAVAGGTGGRPIGGRLRPRQATRDVQGLLL